MKGLFLPRSHCPHHHLSDLSCSTALIGIEGKSICFGMS
jgi:hypothetical protein